MPSGWFGVVTGRSMMDVPAILDYQRVSTIIMFFPMKQMGQWWLGYIYIFDKLISGEHVSKPAFKANKVGWGLP